MLSLHSKAACEGGKSGKYIATGTAKFEIWMDGADLLPFGFFPLVNGSNSEL